jgi:hypothetical protein
MPRRFPLYRFAALILSFAALVWFVHIWQRTAPIVKRYDLSSFLRTTLPAVPFWDNYIVAMHGTYLADSNDTDAVLSSEKGDHDKLHDWLQANVYDGRSLAGVLRWPLAGFGIVLIAGMALGGWMDRRRVEDRVVRGPRLISKWRWNWPIWGRRRGLYIETR